MEFTVRPVRPGDLPAILAISNHAAETTAANFAIAPEPLADWERAFAETAAIHPWLLAADADQAVLGFAKSSPWKGRCAYAHAVETTVYVAPDRHRRGVGHALYAQLLALLERQGYRSALGGIALPNEASVALHESFGFRSVARFERIGFKFGRWHDVGYWMLHFGGDAPPAALRPVAEVLGDP